MVDWSKLEPIKTPQDVSNDLSVEQAKTYLNETNWYAFALLEDGIPIPGDIKQARTAARATLIQLSPPSAP